MTKNARFSVAGSVRTARSVRSATRTTGRVAAALTVAPVTTTTASTRSVELTEPEFSTENENEKLKEYLPLVRTVVARIASNLPPHVDVDDLQSAGMIGLLQAMRNFNAASGTSFSTYARLRIRGSVLDELRRMDPTPRSVHEKSRKIERARAELTHKLRRTPTSSEMAEALEIEVPEFERWVSDVKPISIVCLDSTTPSEHGEGTPLHETIMDEAQEDPTEDVSKRELLGLIQRRLDQLPTMQRKVLALYYFEELRLREIAEAFGLTESRICQIHAQALQSIRTFVRRYEMIAA